VNIAYVDPSNPSETEIGNIIIFNNADLHNAEDIGTPQGQVQGTCTRISTADEHYCTFAYEIFNDEGSTITFTADGRVDNSDTSGSIIPITGGFNGLEDASGTVILTPVMVDNSESPPEVTASDSVFDGYLAEFQVILNYGVASIQIQS
jgi:hypothetical protein